jgi:hypothetical protein
MTEELRITQQSRQLYNSSLSSAWSRIQTFDPSLWLLRDPDAEEKMMRDADISFAVGHRQKLIAGRAWDLLPREIKNVQSELAVGVGTELVKGIKKFTDSRLNLASAFFNGQRFAWIHGEKRPLRLGDGKVRNWWVPRKLEDMDKRNFRIVTDSSAGEGLKAHWQRWNIGEKIWEDVSLIDSGQLIDHTYEDNQGTMGYGRALRESIGWWWYAKAEVFQQSLKSVDRFAGGNLMAKVDGLKDADTGLPNQELYESYLDMLENMRGRHAVVLDKDDEIETVSYDGQGWQMLSDMRGELRDTIFTLILGANLPTSASEGGSFALAQVQENSTEALIQFDRQALEETLTDSLMGCIWRKNVVNMRELGIADDKPRFNITQEKLEDPRERAETASILNGMGVALSAEDLYEKTGWKKPEPGEEVIEGATAPGGFGLGGFDFGPASGSQDAVSLGDAPQGEIAKVQDTALNGAQVTAAADIIDRVVQNTMPASTAVLMLVSMFNMPQSQAQQMVDDAAAFTPSSPMPEGA